MQTPEIDQSTFFAVRLKAWRISAGKSTEEMAKIAGVTPQSWAGWEAGKAKPQVFVLLAILAVDDEIDLKWFFLNELKQAKTPDFEISQNDYIAKLIKENQQYRQQLANKIQNS